MFRFFISGQSLVGYFVHHFSSLLIFLLIQEPIYLYGWRRNRTIHNLRATLCCCGWGESWFRSNGGQGSSSSSSSYTSFEIYIPRLLMMGSSILKNQSCKCFSLSSLPHPLFIRFRPSSPFFLIKIIIIRQTSTCRCVQHADSTAHMSITTSSRYVYI